MTTTPGPRQNAPSAIQSSSSPSASVYWLNLDQIRRDLKKAVERLAHKHTEIEEVWLFGSLARGDAVPGSDADLLVLLRDSRSSFLDRMAQYQPDFCGVGVDVFAYTQAEVAGMRAEGNSFLERAQAEGVRLFQRSGQDQQR
jgi:predicted nucleotidyltransferase